MVKIGLTGGIASGKSTASEYIKSLGYEVIDADEVSNLLSKKGESIYIEIVRSFGREILQEDLEIDRRKLGDIVFSDEDKLKMLNDISHRLILEEIRFRMNECEENEGLIFVDIPLLFECNLKMWFDEVWVIGALVETQMERLKKRNNFTDEEAFNRISAQMPLKTKMDLSDEVILNEGTIEELYKNIDKLLSRLKM
jgi:dephospho-CoA kinase